MTSPLDEEYRIIEDTPANTSNIKLIERSVRRAFVVFKNDKSECFKFEKYINVSVLGGKYKYKEGRTGELSYREKNINYDLEINDKGFHEILSYIVEDDFAKGFSLNNLLQLTKTNMTALVGNRYDIYPELVIQRDDDNEFLLSARVCEDFLFRKVTVDVVDKVSKMCLDDLANVNSDDYAPALKLK